MELHRTISTNEFETFETSETSKFKKANYRLSIFEAVCRITKKALSEQNKIQFLLFQSWRLTIQYPMNSSKLNLKTKTND